MDLYKILFVFNQGMYLISNKVIDVLKIKQEQGYSAIPITDNGKNNIYIVYILFL